MINLAIGFKNSFFGFNKQDVLSYISKSNADAKNKIDNLTKQLDTASGENEVLKEQACILEATNKELSEKLAELESKKAEIFLMSEKISRLYLTAKSSAAAVMKNTEENCRLMNEEVLTNLNSLENVHSMLQKLREQINSTAENYGGQVDQICDSLEAAKMAISSNDANSRENINAFTGVLNNDNL